jgi:hypothetical protein
MDNFERSAREIFPNWIDPHPELDIPRTYIDDWLFEVTKHYVHYGCAMQTWLEVWNWENMKWLMTLTLVEWQALVALGGGPVGSMSKKILEFFPGHPTPVLVGALASCLLEGIDRCENPKLPAVLIEHALIIPAPLWQWVEAEKLALRG